MYQGARPAAAARPSSMQNALLGVEGFINRLRQIYVGRDDDRTPHKSVKGLSVATSPAKRINSSTNLISDFAGVLAAKLRLGSDTYRWHLVGSSKPGRQLGQGIISALVPAPPETRSRERMMNGARDRLDVVQKAPAGVGAIFDHRPYTAFHRCGDRRAPNTPAAYRAVGDAQVSSERSLPALSVHSTADTRELFWGQVGTPISIPSLI
jgi:hypothetical protein